MLVVRRRQSNLLNIYIRDVEDGGKEGIIDWQAQTTKKWLADLLANETAVVRVLRILKATDIGRARERGLEWERKNNQAGEDLLE